VILSPSQCSAVEDADDITNATIITNAAAYFYALDVSVNTSKVWVCRDLTAVEPSTLNPRVITEEGRMDIGSASHWEHSVYR